MATPKKRNLPGALVANAARAVETKAERTKKEATSDVALVERRKADVAESFYDIGLGGRLLVDRVASVLFVVGKISDFVWAGALAARVDT